MTAFVIPSNLKGLSNSYKWHLLHKYKIIKSGTINIVTTGKYTKYNNKM